MLRILICLGALASGFVTVAWAAERPSLESLQAALPGTVVTPDALRGTPRQIVKRGSTLTGPAHAAPQTIVADFVATHAAAFGDGILADAEAVWDQIDQHSGVHHLRYQQQVAGVPVDGAVLSASVLPDGRLLRIGSTCVIGLRGLAAIEWQGSASKAVSAALQALGAGGNKAVVLVAPEADDRRQRQELRADGAVGDVHAWRCWHAPDHGQLRASWLVTVTEAATGLMWEMVIDDRTGAVHAKRNLTCEGCFAGLSHAHVHDHQHNQPVPPEEQAPAGLEGVAAATEIALRVYTSPDPTPRLPGWPMPTTTQPDEVPRELVTLTALSSNASPEGWVGAEGETRGNNVDAHADADANNIADTPRPAGSGSPLTFDFPLDLTQQPASYRDAAIVNLFYWCNVCHDVLYDLGFTEAFGNFQADNFGRGGSGGDPVQADAQDGKAFNNANFSTPSDGSDPRMQMFLFDAPTPMRDGSLDATIIIHEYAHGLTNRLISNLVSLQGRGMGEGWSDFYALSLLTDVSADPYASYPVGAFAIFGRVDENYFRGIRRFPYHADPDAVVHWDNPNPLTFTDCIINPEVHATGEIWCQTLWDLRAELISAHGGAVGNQLVLQLVTDALKLTPAAPGFVDARDAIVQADLALTGGLNAEAIWRAFARRGLGFSASQGSSTSSFNGIVAANDLPGDLQFERVGHIRFVTAPGMVPDDETLVIRNEGGTSVNWRLDLSGTLFEVDPVSGTLAAGATTAVTVRCTNSAGELDRGGYREQIELIDTDSGRAAQLRMVELVVGDGYRVDTAAPFAWIDPAAHEVLPLADDLSVRRELPFDFVFFGEPYSRVKIDSNGLIGFGYDPMQAESAVNPNDPLPSPRVNRVIAPWWDDLNPDRSGAVYFGTEGIAPNRIGVISWVDVPPYTTGNKSVPGFTFQVLLHEGSNHITCQYLEVQAGLSEFGAGGSATIGLQGQVPERVNATSFNGEMPPTNGQAIRYWLPKRTITLGVTGPDGTPSLLVERDGAESQAIDNDSPEAGFEQLTPEIPHSLTFIEVGGIGMR